MSKRMESGLRALVLAIHDEATVTAVTKGLTGALAQLAALQETADLASAQAGRVVSEEEVMRIVLHARRTRNARGTAQQPPVDTPAKPPAVAVRRRRLLPATLRSAGRLRAGAVRGHRL